MCHSLSPVVMIDSQVGSERNTQSLLSRLDVGCRRGARLSRSTLPEAVSRPGLSITHVHECVSDSYSVQEWTVAAVAWLQDQLSLDPNAVHASQDLLDHVDLQLLQSDLSDSMLHNTGLPSLVQSMKNGVIATPATGGPVLVQVMGVMEIGASAFNLMNVRQTRKDGTDLSGLAVGTEEEGGEGAKEARYPRGMLSLTLSDGSVQFKAIEYKRIEGLILGETPLGFKVRQSIEEPH
jgi:RecQ-mediated genome instability protein 1